MKIMSRRLIILAVLSFGLLSCSSTTEPVKTEGGNGTVPYSRDAVLLALYLSEEVFAPDSLYQDIARDLHVITSEYSTEYELLANLHFKFPWVENNLLVGFETETYQQVKNGEYHSWDSLNTLFCVSDIRYRHGFVTLVFDSLVHMARLDEIYGGLPGVQYACRNWRGGDFSNIFAKEREDGLTYLFRHAWGPGCIQGGCNSAEYWYFKSIESHPDFIGYWPRYSNFDEPDWWNEARQNWTDWSNLYSASNRNTGVIHSSGKIRRGLNGR